MPTSFFIIFFLIIKQYAKIINLIHFLSSSHPILLILSYILLYNKTTLGLTMTLKNENYLININFSIKKLKRNCKFKFCILINNINLKKLINQKK